MLTVPNYLLPEQTSYSHLAMTPQCNRLLIQITSLSIVLLLWVRGRARGRDKSKCPN